LWYVAAPSLAAVEAPDPDPQSMRRTVEHGVVTFLAGVARSLPGIVLFIDRYELCDEASSELLHKIAASAEGLAMPLVTASRDDGPRPNLADQCVIELAPLGCDDAAELLDELTRGAALPPSVRQDVLHRAAGVPLFLEEMVSSLIDSGQLRQQSTDTWTFDLSAEIVPLPPSLQAAMVSRLDRLPDEAHDLLCQCSVQGSDFDVQVAEWVRRDPPWQGPPPPPMLTRLGGLGIVGRVQPEDERRWAFVRPVMQEACYETLLMRDRRELHARTADALCALAGSRCRVSATLLADHEERAERWMHAAEAHLAAGRDAAELFLNDQALRHFARVLELVERAAAAGELTKQAARITAAAHGGAARVYLLIGEYDNAREQAERMLACCEDRADRAEANRLLAAVHARTGQIEHAVTLLQTVVALASSERCHEIGAISHAWHDLAHLHYRANRLDEAVQCVAACRQTVCDDPRENQIRADLLEGVILHTRGRFDDSAALYRRAHAAAQEVGSLSQQARAINSLGNIERDRGDYATARVHFESALAIWQKMGDAECIAGAHNNLGNVALSIGDFDAAAHHHAQSSKQWERIGNVRGAAMGQANLALLALERDDGHGAVTAATEAMRMLHNTADRVLRDLVTVVLGEGMARCGALEPAEALFDQVLESCDEAEHPLACAGAWRGKGIVRIERGEHGDAVQWLSKAADAYRALKRAQEEGRTHLLMADALAADGQRERAVELAKRAAEQLEAIGATRDGERARRVVAGLERDV
jgi:tetratricopeptide (TPR) repeat protein